LASSKEEGKAHGWAVVFERETLAEREGGRERERVARK
jgi:hypothetical protein